MEIIHSKIQEKNQIIVSYPATSPILHHSSVHTNDKSMRPAAIELDALWDQIMAHCSPLTHHVL